MSMILLEPANTIIQLNVEIKRRTISLTGLLSLPAFHPPPHCVLMANHWDTKCTNEGCGHRKGNHHVMAKSTLPYRVRGMPGRPGVNEIGHCQVMYERMKEGYITRTCF